MKQSSPSQRRQASFVATGVRFDCTSTYFCLLGADYFRRVLALSDIVGLIPSNLILDYKLYANKIDEVIPNLYDMSSIHKTVLVIVGILVLQNQES